MLRFQHQEYFVFLLLVGLAVAAFFGYQFWRKKKIQLFGNANLVKDLMPSYSATFTRVKFFLLAAALFFGVVGLANLQKRGKVERIAQKGIDVMIALDVSNSMYAQDLSPSRLEKAKLFADKLLEKLSGNRIGLVLFAGRSYLSVPLTNDIEALKMNLSLATPENLPSQGTVIGDALQLSFESFNSKDAKHKAVVLISDGEDHDEKAINQAKNLGKKGIMLCAVGVGSENGAPIPMPTGGNKMDRDGKEILSKMNEVELKSIADAGQGIFVNLSNISSNVTEVANRLDQISKTNLGESRLAKYSSYFQYFLGVMLLLLIVEFFLPARKPNKRLRTAFHALMFLLVPQMMFAQVKVQDKNIANGNTLYEKQQFEKAAAEYQKSIEDKKSKTKEPARFNLGNALFRGKNSEQAIKQFEFVGAKAKDKKMSAFAYHNAGNVMAQDQKWQQAIEYYKVSLKKNPNSPETKYNLAYAKKKLQEQQNKKKDKDKKDDKQKREQEKEKDKEEQKEPEKPKEDGKPKDDEKPKEKKDEGDKEKKKRPQPQPSKLSKQQAKKLLDALNREEKKVKDKKEKGKAGVQILEKDW